MNALWTVALVLVPALLPHGARAETLDIQTGSWEVTTRISQPRRTVVETHCLPERSLLHLVHGPDAIEDDPCRPAGPAKASRHAWAIVLHCDDGSQVHARFTSAKPQTLDGTVVRVGGKRALLQKLELSGRWLRSSCEARTAAAAAASAAKPRRAR